FESLFLIFLRIQAHRNPLSILTDPSGVYHIRARSRKNLPRSSETGQYAASVALSEDAATEPNSNIVMSTLGAVEGRVTSTAPFILGIVYHGFETGAGLVAAAAFPP
ncbi:hypothetical protein Tco_1415785, partial [Tanacetum coccineum]